MNNEEQDYEVKIRSTIKQPLISVIIPVYNVQNSGFFSELLSAIDNQGNLPVEYVFADDASKDESLTCCLDFGKDRQDVTVLHLIENRQRGGALNRCIKESRGEYIALLDSDDYVSDNYFSTFCETIELYNHPDAIIPGALHSVDENSKLLLASPRNNFLEKAQGIISDETRRKLVLNHWMFGAWKKDSIFKNAVSYFPEKLFFEDTPTLAAWLLIIDSFRIAEGSIHFFRQHSNSATAGAVFGGKKFDDRIKSSDLILANAKKLDYYKTYKDEFDFYYVFVCLYNTLMKLVANPLDEEQISLLGQHVKGEVPNFSKNAYMKNGYSVPGYPKRYMLKAAYNNPLLFAKLYKILLKCYRCIRK